jgi:anti-sigma-K factor RskA
MSDDEYTIDERETLTAIEQALPRVAPPDDVFDRILAEVQPVATVVPIERSRRQSRRLLVAGVGGLAAAAIIVVGVLITTRASDGPDAQAAIEGISVPAVHGEAAIYGSQEDDGLVRISLEDVPVAPSGHHYEVWLLRRQETTMQSVGAFTPTSSAVDLELALPGAGDYAAVDISVEEDGGPPEHSGTSLAGGTFD